MVDSVSASFTRTTMQLSTGQLRTSLQRTQRELLDSQSQISTGLRVRTPSDDPTHIAAIILLQGRLEARGQEQRNLQNALGVLNSADQALADGFDILNEAKSIAIEQANFGATEQTRTNNATVVDGLLNALLETANRQSQGVSLFGGSQSGTSDGRVFVEFLGGVRYDGAETNLTTDSGLNQALVFNANGQESFGALSSRVSSQVDLDPQATAATTLGQLNGALGRGVNTGSVTVTVDSTAVAVDLTDAQTLGDVVTRINDAIAGVDPAAGSISVVPSGLSLTAAAGRTIQISDIDVGTAADLGIAVSATGSTVTGTDIDPRLTELTPLAALGTAVDLTSGLKITQAKQTKTADFSTAATVQDLINVVSDLNFGLDLRINDLGTGLDLISRVSGVELSIGENAGGTTAEDLGLRSFGQTTKLADFHHGAGVSHVQGQDDFAIRLHDGSSINVNIDSLTTVSDLITAIQTAATTAGLSVGAPGAAGTDLNVGLVPDGNGLTFEDGTTGANDFLIELLGLSQSAEDLGINTNAGTASTIVSQDVAQIRTESVFTHLIALRQALLDNDSSGIAIASESIDTSIDQIGRARAEIGFRAQRVEQEQERSTELQNTELVFLSELRDADLTEVITRFTQLQQQLQASLQVGSVNLQLSLLNFLR